MVLMIKKGVAVIEQKKDTNSYSTLKESKDYQALKQCW